jgi:hypothetical protein
VRKIKGWKKTEGKNKRKNEKTIKKINYAVEFRDTDRSSNWGRRAEGGEGNSCTQ